MFARPTFGTTQPTGFGGQYNLEILFFQTIFYLSFHSRIHSKPAFKPHLFQLFNFPPVYSHYACLIFGNNKNNANNHICYSTL